MNNNFAHTGPTKICCKACRPTSEYLLEVADRLLHLPETFPASYLQLYDPLVPQCLKLSGSLQFIDLETMLGSNALQLDRASLQDSIVGNGFLTTAQYIADLFFAVADIPGVRNAQFPAMLCYSDPDYWLGALLLARRHAFRVEQRHRDVQERRIAAGMAPGNDGTIGASISRACFYKNENIQMI